MANPNFLPTISTNDVWRDLDDTRCLTDDLDTIESNIATLQTGKAASDHTHSAYALTSHTHTEYSPTSHGHSEYAQISALPTNVNGDVRENLSNKDVLSEIASKTSGMYTFYAASGSTNNPKSGISWRYLVHKTNVPYGWVMAFGSDGSVYANYLHNGIWNGWKVVVDNVTNVLWQHPTGGGYFMNAGHTINLSKNISDCEHGIVLVWSDYDSSTDAASDSDFTTTVVPKKMVNGSNWNGKSFLCVVPVNMTDTTDSITLKRLYVYDNSIVGHAHNSTGTARVDAILRCVYEY